jgi:hypothetical protein
MGNEAVGNDRGIILGTIPEFSLNNLRKPSETSELSCLSRISNRVPTKCKSEELQLEPSFRTFYLFEVKYSKCSHASVNGVISCM